MRTPAHARFIRAEKPLVIHDVCLNPGHVCVSIKPDFFGKEIIRRTKKPSWQPGSRYFYYAREFYVKKTIIS
jgi:hypothetical protein